MIIPSPVNGKEPKIHEEAFIAPTAVIIGDVEIDEGTNVWPGAKIRAAACKIKIGKNCSIQDNVIIHSEFETSLTIGEEVLIGHGAIVHGPGDIGDRALIGIGAIKLQKKSVGEGCLIGAGSLVTKDIPDYVLAFGSPAQLKGKRTKEDATPKNTGLASYSMLCKAFKEKGLDQREEK
ncbi:MAG: gamma carbonic anhydrase family protein [Candidatus Hodarchaeota archaeon]